MDSFTFELWIAQYKAIIKKTGERALFPDEMKRLDDNIEEYMPEEYRAAYTLAREGNYSQFEKLPHLLRNYLGAKALADFREKFGSSPSLERDEVREYLEKNAMNAALRAGISAEKNALAHRGESAESAISEEDAENTRKYANALDMYMNGILMKRTMAPAADGARAELASQFGGEEQAAAALERNKAKQLVMAKAMLLAQIGKYNVISKNGLSSDLDVPVYETIVHGNRTNFVLPLGKDSQSVINAFMGELGGAAGIEKRTAATHSVKRRAIAKSGVLSSAGKEERTYSPFKVFSNQYGMDVAVGGLGETGPDARAILGKGESGHMYMRAEAGDSKHCGSLLIGVEGSAPGADNYLGNEHGIRAKSAKQSAFLADKAIVGKKVGGREVDLSGISAADLTELLNGFSESYGELQNRANTPEGLEKLSRINDLLMGKRMNESELIGFFGELGMANERTSALVGNARGGYLSGVKAGEVTKDAFEQSIRKGFSQENACALAEARFAQSTDLAHSVGAIKELMLTHKTRGLGWKLRHPIKNYLENAKISDLTKRLKEEKHFTPTQIADEFLRESDSFAMDFGSALSNDRAAVEFGKANKQNFLKGESMLLGVLKADYSAEIKAATPKSEAADKMKDELKRAVEERARNRVRLDLNAEDLETKRIDDVSKAAPVSEKALESQKKI